MKITHKAAALMCAAIFAIGVAQARRINIDNFAPNVPQRVVTALPNLFHAKPSPNATGYASLMAANADGKTGSGYAYLTAPSTAPPLDIARQFMADKVGTNVHYVVKNQYTSKNNGVTHVYLRQIVNGLEVENGDANINVDKQGRVLSYGESFYSGQVPPLPSEHYAAPQPVQGQLVLKAPEITAPITAADAVRILAEHLKMPVPDASHVLVKPNELSETPDDVVVLGYSFTVTNGIPVTKKYITRDDGEGNLVLELVWDVQAEMDDNWFHAHVSAQSGEVLGLLDWVSESSYSVFPLGVNDPSDGDRVLVVNPEDKYASPLGWHSQSARDASKKWTTTVGNNVYAQENLDGSENGGYLKNYRPNGHRNLTFNFAMDLTDEPKSYLDASVTNLFFWNNMMHDIFHKYGFDEEAGNFQENNFGRGGRGGDAVIANAQDGAGFNNANFATPPDGQHGKMRMYVWNTVTPYRDGDLDNGIIIHEYAHGISTRLTGGPANSGCLGWGEAGGMGEGWGDFFATVLRMRPEYTRDMDFAMGTYAMNSEKGIRKFVYSTSMKTNPSTYAFTRKFSYIGVHAKGEVWAVMLYEMYWNLVDKHGFSTDIMSPNVPRPAGNIVALQLVIDGMKLQPCRPSFVDARDAIIQADEADYNGENVCEIWKAFAKRGLGLGARAGGHESFELPAECQKSGDVM